MKNIVLAFCLAISSQLANAQMVTGNQLIGWLDNSAKVQAGSGSQADVSLSEVGMLFGYISAVADGGQVKGICVPEGVTMGQMIAIVDKYVRPHPERWNESANVLVTLALWRAFPCQKK